MVGTATFLAFWVLAAAPGTATASSDRDGDTVQVIFQEQSPFVDENGEIDARFASPAPKRLPSDSAFEAKPAPLASSQEGIPGLAPFEDEQPAKIKEAPKTEKAPKTKKAPQKEEAPKTKEEAPKPKEEAPKIKEVPRTEEAPKTEADIAEIVCSDQPSGEACPGACEQACDNGRRGWFRDICVDGWIDQGITVNTLSPRDRSNGTVGFNNRSNEYQLNQSYLRFRRAIDAESDAWQTGGQIDLLYGTDSFYATARGLEVNDDFSPKWNAQQYGLAMPQVYAEVFAPWGNGVNVKLGHFYSFFGYEAVTAPDNFFYSHSYTFMFGEPITYTGAVGSTKVGNFTIEAGMTRGWDNWNDNNGNLGFVGGLDWNSPNGRTCIGIDVTAGPEQPDGSDVRTAYSLMFLQKLGERWQYVLQHDLGTEPGAGPRGSTASWYGLNQYLFYTVSETWKAGMRYEWFRDDGGARVPTVRQTADFFELSAGLNWTPSERVTVRPELRWDWTTTADCRPFGDHTRSSQILLDCDVIVKF